MLEAAGICKGFKGRTILSNLSLSVTSGEMIVVLGGSGSGKSLLFRLMLGLETPDQGRVSYGCMPWCERSLKQRQETMKRVGAIFQGGQLFNDQTVFENLLATLDHTENRNESRRQIQKVLSECQFDSQNVDRYPGSLSGGERLRAAIARAIMNDPDYLLTDEPTAGLDPRTAEIISTQLRKSHCAKPDRISMIITHDLRCAAIVADRILFLDRQRKQLVTLMTSEEIEGYRCEGKEGLDQLEEALTDVIPATSGKMPQADAGNTRQGNYPEKIAKTLQACGDILSAFQRLRIQCAIDDFGKRFFDFFIRSLPLICFVGIVIGAAFILSLFAALEIYGAELESPRILGLAIVREIGPLIAGLLLCGRLGANVAAEMGLRKTQKEFDMLHTMGRDPNAEYFTPMILAAMVSLPLLFFIMDLCAICGGFIPFQMTTGNSMQSYLGAMSESLAPQDILFTVAKGCIFGYLILSIAYELGSSVQQPYQTIERQVGKAVVIASVAIIAANFLIMRIYDQLF